MISARSANFGVGFSNLGGVSSVNRRRGSEELDRNYPVTSERTMYHRSGDFDLEDFVYMFDRLQSKARVRASLRSESVEVAKRQYSVFVRFGFCLGAVLVVLGALVFFSATFADLVMLAGISALAVAVGSTLVWLSLIQTGRENRVGKGR